MFFQKQLRIMVFTFSLITPFVSLSAPNIAQIYSAVSVITTDSEGKINDRSLENLVLDNQSGFTVENLPLLLQQVSDLEIYRGNSCEEARRRYAACLHRQRYDRALSCFYYCRPRTSQRQFDNSNDANF